MVFIFLQLIYLIFRCIAPNSNVTKILFDLIKQEVYEFGGGCKNSGNCCSQIMLYDNGKPIGSTDVWYNFLKRSPEYISFKPKVVSNHIQYFDCSSLTCDNHCDRYEDRPQLCRNYPYSFFYQHGYIYDSCGYSVQKKIPVFNRLLPIIKEEMLAFSSI